MTTTTVDVPTPDGTADALLVTPDRGGPHPAVLLYMDAFGVRPRLQQMAERIAAQGYVVLVPNVFHRAGRAPVVDLVDLMAPENRPSMLETLGPHLGAATTAAEVYVSHADGDSSATPEQQERLESALTSAGVTHRTELYAGASHGFTMTDTAAYSAEAEQRHRTELLALLDRTSGRPVLGRRIP